jgi:hypothetical protein
MSQQEEWQTYQTLDHAQQKQTSLAARFKRKLALRRVNRRPGSNDPLYSLLTLLPLIHLVEAEHELEIIRS